ncbi:rod shape-determining protein MreC [Candidatus Nomurabacteria bacterium]|nr:rod shape-determining protein MreC [Candidatus Nomurabacteria bacterium]
MSYLQDKSKRRKRNWIVLAGVLVFIIFFYFRAGIWSGLSYASGEIFRPILALGNNAGVKFKNFSAYFSSKRSLENENEILLSKLADAESRMLNYDLLNAENESLKEILGRQKEDAKMVLGAILSKPNQSAYDTLLIDAGENEGIKTGDIVFALGDIPVGRVGAVTPNSSKIILFSSAGEKTQALISGNEIFYELVGRGGGNFEMVLPRDIALTKGDKAVMPGLYPYVLAEVETTISDPRDPFTKALFVSPVNIQELKFVEVATSP